MTSIYEVLGNAGDDVGRGQHYLDVGSLQADPVTLIELKSIFA